MMIAKDPAVASAIRATAFTPMPLTVHSVRRLLPEAEGDKTSAGGHGGTGIEPAQDFNQTSGPLGASSGRQQGRALDKAARHPWHASVQRGEI